MGVLPALGDWFPITQEIYVHTTFTRRSSWGNGARESVDMSSGGASKETETDILAKHLGDDPYLVPLTNPKRDSRIIFAALDYEFDKVLDLEE